MSNLTKRHLDAEYPYDVTLTKNDKEGFGFVVISSLNKGPTIGMYNVHTINFNLLFRVIALILMINIKIHIILCYRSNY